jgi:putative phosphoesterase
MLLGIISDTHDKLARTRHAIVLLREAGAEALIHCGDLIGPEILAACAVCPCWFVFGNNDEDAVPDLRQAASRNGAVCLDWAGEVTLAGKRIAVTHGHMHSDVRRLLAAGPDYLLTGHSHLADDEKRGNCRRINPGALHRAAEFSVALLNLQTDELKFLKVPS